MASMILPSIKCSDCGCNVEISALGDHVCVQTGYPPALPSPPPSAGLESPGLSKQRGPPPRIDPSVANQAFLQPNVPTPASIVGLSPMSVSPAPKSPMPRSPADNNAVIELDSVFSFPMPGNRSPTHVRTPSPMTGGVAKSLPLIPLTTFGLGMVPENIQLPPSPLPPQSPASEPAPEPAPEPKHSRGESVASRSSYGSSFASSRYGDSTARSSTNSFTRGFRTFMDDTPPVPPAPLRTPHKNSFSRDSNMSVVSSRVSSRSDREEIHGGFDFGIPTDQTSTLHELPEESPSDEQKDQHDYEFQSSTQNHLHPAAAAEPGSDAPRKNSDASTASALSVTSFARALGLEDQMNHDGSTSSDSSPSDARSGSSMSSLPSDASLNRHKPIDPLNLGPLVEELPARTRQTILEIPGRQRSPMEDVPTIPAAYFSPDSPTDPAIGQGGLSLIASKAEVIPTPTGLTPTTQSREPSPMPPPQRSFTAPIPGPPTRSPTSRSAGRSKGTCKGCNEVITGKSISSSDGRLTGRYHRGCFVCFECHSPFQTADFYVLNNRPFCAQHYHERNGSLCAGCHTGIEGHYLETVERNPARPDRRRFHTECLQCRTCHILLKGDYFEWNGEVYCERDARRAAGYHQPHGPPGPPGPGGRAGRSRPTLGSSPLSQSREFPPSGYPSPMPGQGLRPGARLTPGGGGRFPERRTTRLMMI